MREQIQKCLLQTSTNILCNPEQAGTKSSKQTIYHNNVLMLRSSNFRQQAARNRRSQQPDKKQMAAP